MLVFLIEISASTIGKSSIILAYQLGRKDPITWSQHIRPAANFLVNFVS
jgi:hypothetical protein